MKEPAEPAERIDEDLATTIQRAFDLGQPPATFRELWAAMMSTFAAELDRDLDLDDLCTTAESPHWATVGDDRQHYQCVTDAFILGSALDEPMTARTECPVTGTDVRVAYDDEGGVDAPSDAVLAYGVRRDVEAPSGPITPAKMYSRFCPYNKAFASRAAYEEWAEATPDVVSQAQDLERALGLLSDLVGSVTGIDEDTLDRDDPDPGCSC